MRITKKTLIYGVCILLLMGFPIFIEILFRLLLANNIFHTQIYSVIKFLREIFPNKEVLWTAYTGVITGISVYIALIQPSIIKEEERKQYKESLIEGLKAELLTNWDYLSSDNIEIQISRNAYNIFVKELSLFKTEIDREDIASLNQLYNLFSVFEYQRNYFYDKKFTFGRRELGDDILMRNLALSTFLKRCECLVKLTSFITNLPENEEMKELSLCSGLTEKTFPRAIKNIKQRYIEKVKSSSIDKLTINPK